MALLVVSVLLLLLVVAIAVLSSRDAEATGQGKAAPRVHIPEVSTVYRLMVEREVADMYGIHAQTARVAAQIHQESLWDPNARSHAGAQGMTQFMPATSRWIAEKFPRQLGTFDPHNPQQAVRAMLLYNRFLTTRNPGATACDTAAFGMAGYNGGETWLRRDQRLAAAAGDDPARWFDHVERHTGRAEWARRENRGYVHRILRVLEPAYVAAGWSGEAVCT